MLRVFVVSLALLAVAAFALAAPPPPAANESAHLHDLFAREWKWRLVEDPLFATAVGVHDYDDRLPSAAPEDAERRDRDTHAFLAELGKIDFAKLSDADRVSAELMRRALEDRIESHRFQEEEIATNSDSSFHSDFAQLPDNVPLATVKDYEHYVARLAAFPKLMDEQIAWMRRGLARGFTPPKVTLAGVEGSITPYLVSDPEKSVFWKPFASFPATMPEADRARLAADGKRVIQDALVPAYAKFLNFVSKEYVPGARASLGASALPGGNDYYRYLIRQFTTLDLAPEEIHKIGLEQVDAIRREMDAVIAKTGFQGDFAAFQKFLRTDPRFYAKTPEELLKEASFIAKKIDGKLPSEFKTLPRLPYGVAPVPAAIAPKYTSGRYVPAPVGGTQPGLFWVNTYALDQRPLFNLTALALHEAVPGHHLQGALAQEATNLPNFRRFDYISAFGEGWGLYSEWLGKEMGMYDDPYSDFGRLSYSMWRACRLVVDTGVHAMGWTREQAIDYLASHTALPLHEVETEIDRYISWPAQALSYELGYLKIRELRARAEKALGQNFDRRDFHDALLANGSVTLPILEREIDRFIARQSAPGSASGHPGSTPESN